LLGRRRIRRFAVVARAEPWKRIDRVIDAFAALPPGMRDRLTLQVFGDGPALPALAKQIASLGVGGRVRLRGHLPGDWTRLTDALITGSEIEAFGRVIIEAGNAGLPQIVPDRGGSAELVDHQVTGIMYDTGDTAALTRAITTARWDAATLSRYALAAHRHARRFSIHSCADGYEDLAAALLARPAGTGAKPLRA
jgi:glycosyltransferase involved in cell wall biosynthesis